ncbi:MAG TPA: hypothetical protein VD791_06150, partial [Burkholderiales bacterium]|nr:hypothetical protein [Burkholderiales bacterium]
MRASIASLAAIALIGVGLSGHAAEGDDASESKLAQSGRALYAEGVLKPAGARNKPSLAAEEETLLRSAGTSHRPARMADEDQPLKAAGASSRPGRAADDEAVLKSAGTSYKPGRMADEDRPLKSTTAARPGRSTVKAAGRPG